jgi:predicted transglutaminase-like cysteine proteinase
MYAAIAPDPYLGAKVMVDVCRKPPAEASIPLAMRVVVKKAEAESERKGRIEKNANRDIKAVIEMEKLDEFVN